jgi:hypothetical protein
MSGRAPSVLGDEYTTQLLNGTPLSGALLPPFTSSFASDASSSALASPRFLRTCAASSAFFLFFPAAVSALAFFLSSCASVLAAFFSSFSFALVSCSTSAWMICG